MSDLIDTTEMYLKVIYELVEEGIVPLRARIAERLQQSGPTVSQTVARMERDDLVHLETDRHLELTEHGKVLATRVMRKHRLAERLLVDVIGLEWPLVHNEACRWEHVVSEAVESRLVALLHDPTEDPYGNPIPGMEELGGEPMSDSPHGLERLSDVGEATVTIRRIGEPLQTDEKLLARLDSAGIRPRATVRVRRADTAVRIAGSDDHVDLPAEDAVHIFIS
ncbi:MAG TPA: metal-dependent transcriptional regulator [Jiangellaceae bacterium]